MKIRKLPQELIGKIAAGEIIERPSSVVKELLENSIDAEASRISVRIGDPLYSEISVSDDGFGMSREDALLSLERHSTSKILTESDLFQINTLGFRGEALPSIAQVSRLTLSTRSEEALSGIVIRCVGGKTEQVSEGGRAPGTTVSVKDLFFNTPVRRRFLKSKATELRHVIRIVSSYALAFERIHFNLKERQRELLNLPASSDLFDRLICLYGLQTAEQLIRVESETGSMGVAGYVGGVELSRTSGEHQLFFVNRRWIASPTLTFALRDAYSELLPRDRYPICIIMLTLPSERVDVNIHPTKREVKFADEGAVRAFVFDTVCGALRGASASVLRGIRHGTHVGFRVLDDMPSPIPQITREYEPLERQMSLIKESAASYGRPEAESVMVPLWQLHNTYVLAQIKNGLVIIDQHAAHERILYEEARKLLSGAPPSSQQLLFPLLMNVTPDEFEVLLDIEVHLRKLGFDIKATGKSTIVVRGIPAGLRGWREGQLLHDIIDSMAKEQAEVHSAEDNVARSFACHAAVKAGDSLTLEEMNYLIDRLFGTSMPQGDPHGRPTFIRVSLDELERRFSRS